MPPCGCVSHTRQTCFRLSMRAFIAVLISAKRPSLPSLVRNSKSSKERVGSRGGGGGVGVEYMEVGGIAEVLMAPVVVVREAVANPWQQLLDNDGCCGLRHGKGRKVLLSQRKRLLLQDRRVRGQGRRKGARWAHVYHTLPASLEGCIARLRAGRLRASRLRTDRPPRPGAGRAESPGPDGECRLFGNDRIPHRLCRRGRPSHRHSPRTAAREPQ